MVVLSSAAARRIFAKGRICIGLVNARVRTTELSSSLSLHCLAFGHLLRDYKGVDRSRKCCKCGDEGHFALECGAGVEKKLAFRETLRPDGLETGLTRR